MPQLRQSAPLDEKAQNIVKRVIEARSHSRDKELIGSVLRVLQAIYEDAYGIGFQESRSGCTLCSIVRVTKPPAENSEETFDED